MDSFTEKIIIVVLILASLLWLGTYIINYMDEKCDMLQNDNKKSLRRLKKLMILQYVNLNEQIKSLLDKSTSTSSHFQPNINIEGVPSDNILSSPDMPISLEEAKTEMRNQNQKKSPFDKAEESFDTISGLNSGLNNDSGADFASF